MPRYFIPGSNSLSQSNIDTNNVCPCANNINTKVKNSSNSTALQNFTRVQKQVDIINYSTSGRTMYGNFNPFLGQSAAEYMNTVLASRTVTTNPSTNPSTNPVTNGQYTLNASINNELVGIGNNLTETNPNIFIRCVIPPTRNCIKPLKNKF
jgi:hypothetical protein